MWKSPQMISPLLAWSGVGFAIITDLVDGSKLWCHILPSLMDNFCTLGPPASHVYHSNLQTCVQLCKKLGLPLHPVKLEGPVTHLTIFGIELDSWNLQACPPADKRDKIVTLLDKWSAKRFCKPRKLESLIGHLHHACKVTPQNRTFLCRMINLLCAFHHDNHPIRLNLESPRDLIWWQELL